MPTYAYTCTVCGHSFDVHQSFDDAALTVCPECSGRLRKVFSPVGVVFKGSGFYRTDARSSSKAGAASTTSAPSTSTSSSSSSSGTTSTSTPAAPATAAPAKAANS
ncbi:MAG TPA: FmdB family zinc ribbon protein [Cellulomonas sp.]